MPVFACRLNPPRPDFAVTMNAAEAEAMQAHVGYWSGLLAQGKAVVVGPVLDPAGMWGLGVLEVADGDEAARITAGDPVIRADLGLRYDTFPIPQALLRPLPT